jgi:hypothetical protein
MQITVSSYHPDTHALVLTARWDHRGPVPLPPPSPCGAGGWRLNLFIFIGLGPVRRAKNFIPFDLAVNMSSERT